jgi:cellulose biosynthesis protein BcsQ
MSKQDVDQDSGMDAVASLGIESSKIVTVHNRKGGVGKSVIARSLAEVWYQQGRPVFLIDMDSQRSSYREDHPFAKQKPPFPFEAATDPVKVKELLEKYADTHHIVIDTPGKLAKEYLFAMAVADMVVIPAQPTADDFEPTADVVNMIRATTREPAIMQMRQGVPIQFRILMNRTDPRKANTEVFREFYQKMGIPLFNTEIRDLVALSNIKMTGFPRPNTNAGANIRAFIREIETLMVTLAKAA